MCDLWVSLVSKAYTYNCDLINHYFFFPRRCVGYVGKEGVFLF